MLYIGGLQWPRLSARRSPRVTLERLECSPFNPEVCHCLGRLLRPSCGLRMVHEGGQRGREGFCGGKGWEGGSGGGLRAVERRLDDDRNVLAGGEVMCNQVG